MDGDEFFQLVGLTLTQIQATEAALRHCLTLALPDEAKGPVTVHNLEAIDRQNRRATLGQFVRMLRQRVGVDPRLDGRLDEFVENRNRFVHHLFDDYEIHTAEGREAASVFVGELAYDALDLLKLLLGVLRTWERQSGLNVPTPAGVEDFVERIDREWLPAVDGLFSAKD